MSKLNGIMLVDKPKSITSHDAVDAMRRITGLRKIGHTGTLDPLATGLLILCVGKATKLAQFLTLDTKEYEAEIRLGMRSSTYDAEGIIPESEAEVPELTVEAIESILEKFRGDIVQKVPPFAAVKVNGQRLYKKARRGEEVKSPEREVRIDSLSLLDYNSGMLKINVSCSKGTYIRSLANDIGETIGCGAYLSELRRTRVGKFYIGDAITLEGAEKLMADGNLESYLYATEKALDYPAVKLDSSFTPYIIQGRNPRKENIVDIIGSFKEDEIISLCDESGKIMAVGRSLVSSSSLSDFSGENFFKYVRVLN